MYIFPVATEREPGTVSTSSFSAVFSEKRNVVVFLDVIVWYFVVIISAHFNFKLTPGIGMLAQLIELYGLLKLKFGGVKIQVSKVSEN